MSEAFDRLAMMLAGGGSRRDVLKGLGALLAGGLLGGFPGTARADRDDDDDDDDDHGRGRRNREIARICRDYCKKCPRVRRPHGLHGKCQSHCERFLRRNRNSFPCGTCTATNPFTGCVSTGTCCAATATAAAYCANLQTDVSNCGKCGTVCKGTTPACCSGTCQDLATDAKNCGACGKVCPTATPDCCSGTCVNLQTDNNNCGKCGTKCSSTQTCTAGVCK